MAAPSILVVDDDFSLRTILNDSLKEAGYTVEIAKDGDVAITDAETPTEEAAA